MILAAALLLASVTTKTFANDVKVKPSVLRTFQSTFANVSNVQWSVVGHLYQAVFTVDGETTFAFFSSEDGLLVASSHYITISELPRGLRSTLKTEAADSKILELFEVQSDNGTDYYATLQNGDKTVILKGVSSKWSIYKK